MRKKIEPNGTIYTSVIIIRSRTMLPASVMRLDPVSKTLKVLFALPTLAGTISLFRYLTFWLYGYYKKIILVFFYFFILFFYFIFFIEISWIFRKKYFLFQAADGLPTIGNLFRVPYRYPVYKYIHICSVKNLPDSKFATQIKTSSKVPYSY